ncbi:MAG: shikimate kinase [Candidatus Margulisiibacteriota bacterium]|nr:shikimate kinase [Candidatus Margulisiibacteriota bacterium]
MKTVIFLGMSGVGKSTIGKDVSSHLSLNFIDTDDVIMKGESEDLQSLINRIGNDRFISLEADYIKPLLKPNHIISPGGSFIYSTDFIQTIINDVIFIYLYDTAENIYKRIPNIESRGIVGFNGSNFNVLHANRDKLYKKVAHVQFNINYLGFSKTTDSIVNFLRLNS